MAATQSSTPSVRLCAGFFLAAGLTAFCYLPGLSGPFLFDDEPNITQNSAIQLTSLSLEKLVLAASSYGDRSFKRALSMLSFAVNHRLSGLDPFWFKLTNLVIHLLNGCLVYQLGRSWLRALQPLDKAGGPAGWLEWMPMLVTAAWMLHPLNLTSVLYVVQRMTSLGTFFMLAGMLLYTWGRLRLREGRPRGLVLIFSGLFGGTLLAYGSKENGLLLPLYLWVIEWIMFRFTDPRPRIRWMLGLTFVLVVGLPLAAALGFVALHPHWLAESYGGRSFSLLERVLTQPRVIGLYLKLLLVPSGRDLSLYHDDLEISTGWTQPWTTMPAVLSLGALLVASIGLHRRQPVLAFGVLFFFAGHALESSVFPLEMVHEHRNYLAMVGPLFAAGYYLLRWSVRVGPLPIGPTLAAPYLVLLSLVTLNLSAQWGNLYTLASLNAEHHPGSARWQHELGRAQWMASMGSEDPDARAELAERARGSFLRAADLSVNPAGDLLAVLHVDSALGVAPTPLDRARLEETLAGRLVNPLAVHSYLNWLNCLSSGFCQAHPESVETLTLALLGNRTLSEDHRGKLLTSTAQWALSRGSLESALDLLRQALTTYPREMRHHLNLLTLLIQVHRPGEAREVLAAVKLRTDGYRYREEINALEGALERLEGDSNHETTPE